MQQHQGSEQIPHATGNTSKNKQANTEKTVQTKQGKLPPKQTRESTLPPIQTKEGKKPPIQAKQRPIQRKTKSDPLVQAMEKQHGGNLSEVVEHQNSDLPSQVGAVAVIQGKDIHYASGEYNEENRKHELAHKSINDQRSTPPKADQQINGFPVNTSDEQVADTIANTPLQMPQEPGTTPDQAVTNTNPTNASPPLQRKVNYKNAPEQKIEQIKKTLQNKMEDKKDVLFNKDGKKTLENLFNPSNHEKLTEALKRLQDSEQDYGTFDLNNDQHLLALYFELKKHIASPKDVSPQKEVKDSQESKQEEIVADQEYFKKSPDPSATFKLAILGAGAGAAYYLTSNQGKIDPKRSVLIGEKQPWAGKRGPGVINHPMHMIDAKRSEVGYAKEELAPREQFSEMVEKVINKYMVHRFTEKIKEVKKVAGDSGEMFYQITLEKGAVCYAQEVVSSLGIGPHNLPREGQDPLKSDQDSEGHAMNMDEFQNRAKKIKDTVKDPQDITVVIGGGNAGIDSVMTSIDKGFRIIWVTGSERPALLPGTDNEEVEAAYDKVIDSQKSKIDQVIKDYANNAKTNPESNKKGAKPILVNIGKKDKKDIPADYFVYALGPDVDKVREIYDKDSIQKNLVPTYDKNKVFGNQTLSSVVGLEVKNTGNQDKTSLKIIGGAGFRMADQVSYDYLFRLNDQLLEMAQNLKTMEGGQKVKVTYADTITKYAKESIKDITNIQQAQGKKDLPQLLKPDPSSVFSSIKKQDTPLKTNYLGGLRFLESYVNTLQQYWQQVADFLEKKAQAETSKTRLRANDPRKANAHIGEVVDTLPSNIAVGDQLTTIRGEIEADAGFVPDYVMDDVNFASDNISIIAIYIAANYPHLPGSEVEMWADRIIRWRRPSKEDIEKYKLLQGPLPNPHGKVRENATTFSAWFKKRLSEENTKFANKG